MRVDEDGALENSTDVTNLLVDDFNISMETTGGDASWLNKKYERHYITIHNIVRSGLLGGKQHGKNCSVQRRHHKKSIDTRSTVHYIIPHITLNGMVKITEYLNSEPLDVIYTPSPHILKNYMTCNKNYHYWVIQTE